MDMIVPEIAIYKVVAQEISEKTIARDWIGSSLVYKGAFEMSLGIPPGIQLPLQSTTGLLHIKAVHLPAT